MMVVIGIVMNFLTLLIFLELSFGAGLTLCLDAGALGKSSYQGYMGLSIRGAHFFGSCARLFSLTLIQGLRR